MFSRIRAFFWQVADRLPAVLVLAALAGVGVVAASTTGSCPASSAPSRRGQGPTGRGRPGRCRRTRRFHVRQADDPAVGRGGPQGRRRDRGRAERPMARRSRPRRLRLRPDALRPLRSGSRRRRLAGLPPARRRRPPGRRAGRGGVGRRRPGQGRVRSSLVQAAKEKIFQAVQAQAKVVPGVFPELALRDAEAQMREARTRLFADQQALFNLGLPIARGGGHGPARRAGDCAGCGCWACRSRSPARSTRHGHGQPAAGDGPLRRRRGRRAAASARPPARNIRFSWSPTSAKSGSLARSAWRTSSY